jgi:hypothetical protein
MKVVRKLFELEYMQQPSQANTKYQMVINA